MIFFEKASDSKYKAFPSIVYLVAISSSSTNPLHTFPSHRPGEGGGGGDPEESVGKRMSLNPPNHHIDPYYLRGIKLFDSCILY